MTQTQLLIRACLPLLAVCSCTAASDNTQDPFAHAADPGAHLTQTEVAPVNVIRKGDAHTFVDFGKAAYAHLRLTVDSPAADRTLEIHLGEKLSAPQVLDREPPGTIRYRRTTLKLKQGTHTYDVAVPPDKRNTGSRAILMPPHIGEVLPFRYCEIVGEHAALTPNQLRMVMAHYPFDDSAAAFHSSDDVLNQVWDLCKYTIKATSYCGLYVDGDRERIPYEADAYINQLCHYCVDTEYAMGRATQVHFMHHPTWPTECLLHSPLMAWAEYMYTGDTGFISKHYDDLKVRTLIDLARDDGLISVQTGLVSKKLLAALHLRKPPRDLVDWPPGSFSKGRYGERDSHQMLTFNTVPNAFHYHALVLMQKIAGVLGKKDDAGRFEKQAAILYETFNRVLFDTKRGVYIDGEGATHSSLHANMFPLALGLVPEERKESVVAFVKTRGMACSVYGAQYLLEGLYEAGEADYALELMTAKHDRSWWHMIEIGSTMTLEAWDWKYKNNLDWNHAWGAAPGNIVPRYLLGVRPLEPGFTKALVRPAPGSLESATATVPTLRGPICVGFANRTGQPFSLELELPKSMTARVEIPLPQGKGGVVFDGKRAKARIANGYAVIDNVGPGKHTFATTDKQ